MSILPQDFDLDLPIAQITQESTELPLLKEYAWDFENDDFIYKNGKNVIVEGLEAIKIWIYKTLKTPRYKYLAYSWDFGNELQELIGKRYSQAYLKTEAENYLKDCLLINPYITGVTNVDASIDGRKLVVDCIVNTVYGEVSMSV